LLVFGTIDWGKLAKASTATLLMVLLSLNPIATHPAIAAFGRKSPAKTETAQPSKLTGKLTEVAPPAAIQDLRPAFDDNKPQVAIVSPKPNTVLNDDTVSVQFQVKDLTLFKNKDLGLGPHLHVFLDNQPYQAVYDPSKPLVLEKLTPGTHTIRAFASRPWHESFKNEGAYAETTFHVFTKTGENSPITNLPLLTYSRPQAAYGAEPIMLDFYLTNAPLHLVAKEDNKDDIADWRIRCTINGSSFVLDQWQPVWLKGFKPGKNWVQLEFLDDNGNLVKNAFNNTARVITYEPGGKDTLSKLVRGDLSVADARGIVDADYKPPVPVPTPTPEVKPSPSLVPVPVAPVVKATPTPAPAFSPGPLVKPSPVVESAPMVKETPQVEVTPQVEPSPPVKATPKTIAPKPAASPAAIAPVVPGSKPVEIVPKVEEIERPKAVEPPQGDVPKVGVPPVELPKTLTAPSPSEPINRTQPVVPPKVVPRSAPLVERQPDMAEPTKTPEVNLGEAAQAAQTQFGEKTDQLKTQMTSQFNRFRDRFRKTSPPQLETTPAPEILPVVPSKPTAPAPSAVNPLPVIEAP
jgi:hypothetical protein